MKPLLRLSTLTVLLLLGLAGLALGWLVMGAGRLERTLPGGLPVGNAVTAVALVFPALAAVLVSRAGSLCRRLSQIGLLAAVAWLPLSILLAGNVQLNFHGGRGTLWLALSLSTLVLVTGSLAWAIASALTAARKDG